MSELGVLAGNSTEPRPTSVHARRTGRSRVHQGLCWGNRRERYVSPLASNRVAI